LQKADCRSNKNLVAKIVAKTPKVFATFGVYKHENPKVMSHTLIWNRISRMFLDAAVKSRSLAHYHPMGARQFMVAHGPCIVHKTIKPILN